FAPLGAVRQCDVGAEQFADTEFGPAFASGCDGPTRPGRELAEFGDARVCAGGAGDGRVAERPPEVRAGVGVNAVRGEDLLVACGTGSEELHGAIAAAEFGPLGDGDADDAVRADLEQGLPGRFAPIW